MFKHIISIKFIIFITISFFCTNSFAVEDLQNKQEVNQQKINQQEIKFTGFADIIEPLLPTVVNIYTTKHSNKQNLNSNFFTKIFSSERINKFANQYNIPALFKNDESNNTSNEVNSLGSGFIVDGDGFIVTNYHVIADSDEIFIRLSNNVEFPARVIGSDPKTDLALLKIEVDQPLPYVNFADSSNVRIGDLVIAIGNPLGFGGTVTTGIISSKSRDLGIDKNDLVDNFIQTDTTINVGSSGGPLFDINGNVIGINTAMPKIQDSNNSGISFSIPINTVQSIIHELRIKGKVNRGKIDVTVQKMTPELAEAFGVPEIEGLLVVSAKKGGSADKHGIKRGDIITSFNGKSVLTPRKLELLIADREIGEKVDISIIRNNKKMNIAVEISEQKPSEELDQSEINGLLINHQGIIFSNIGINDYEKLGVDIKFEGIFIKDVQVKSDLKINDIIISIDQRHIKNLTQFEEIYKQLTETKKQKTVLLIKRGDTEVFVPYVLK